MLRRLFVILLFFTHSGQAQILFQKGYFISTSGEETICFIKNEEWLKNPQKFHYRLSENEETKTAHINDIKEFGIYDEAKYIRKDIQLDTSSTDLKNLGTDRNPEFKNARVFLKVLVEGEPALFSYTSSRSEVFFINYNGKTEQLIFKYYRNVNEQLATNEAYKQQLWSEVRCAGIQKSRIENLLYKKQPLVNLVSDLNECLKSDYRVFQKRKKYFGLSIKPGINYSGMVFSAPVSDGAADGFKSRFEPRLGLEAEFVLPFNRRKWAIVFEPSYQRYKGVDTIRVSQGYFVNNWRAEVDYRFIETALGLRHYIYLKNQSKIFLNAFHINDISLTRGIRFTKISGTLLSENVKMEAGNNFGAGAGIQFKNRFSAELKIQTTRKKITNYHYWFTGYNAVSFIIGYKLI